MIKKQKAARKSPYTLVTGGYLLLMATIFPLWFHKGGLTDISKAKANFFLILSAVYLFSLLFLFLGDLLHGKIRFSSVISAVRRFSWPQRFILFYLLFTLLSALLSDYSSVAWLGGSRGEGALCIAAYCLVFLCVSSFYEPNPLLLFGFGASVTVFCIISILQILGFNPFGLFPEIGAANPFLHYGASFLGTIGNIDSVATFFCIAIPIFWVALLRLSGRLRLLLTVPLLLCLYLLWKISVAAGFLGVVLGGLLSLPVVLPVGTKVKKYMAWGIALLLAGCLVGAYFLDLPQEELHELHEILHGNFKNSYGSGRVFIWRRVLENFRYHLWFGTGPDTLSLTGVGERQLFNAAGEMTRVKLYDAAHNEYLNILYHQGIFALTAYLGALVFSAVHWLKNAAKDGACALLGAAALTYCIQAFFGISQPITAPYFWCVLATLNAKRTASS